jgi:hypothetical protein
VYFEDVTISIYNHGEIEVDFWEATFPVNRLGFDGQLEIEKYEEILENTFRSFLENRGDLPSWI